MSLSDRIELRYHDKKLDDVVVEDVKMARLERMGDFIWIALYLDDTRITFHIPGNKMWVVENPLEGREP